jgi:hypothetical protein
MEKRPSDYKIQPLFKSLTKARDGAYKKLKDKNFDLTKLSPRKDLEHDDNDDDDDDPVVKPNPVVNNNDDDDDDDDPVVKPKPVVNNNNDDDPAVKPTPVVNNNNDDDDDAAIATKHKLLGDMAKIKKQKKSVGPKINQLTGKIMDSEEVYIAGEKFIIRFDEKSRTRRRDIFLEKDNDQKLTDVENALLAKLCITEDTYEAVRMYLYDFFESLPNCQSSMAVLSNKQCEVAYYVLWSVLLKARQDVQRKIDDAKKKSESEIKVQQYEARLKSMSMRNVVPYDGPKPCDISHDEHVEIEGLIKRLEGKLDSVKQKVNTMKGGGCKLMNSMAVGSEASYEGVITQPVTSEAATGLMIGGNRLTESMMVGYEAPYTGMDNLMKGGGCKLIDSMSVGSEASYEGVITQPLQGGALGELKRIYALYS